MKHDSDDIPVPRRVLVIQTAFLGDLILTLPLMQATKEAFPQAKIWALVTPETREMLFGQPALEGCLVYDKRNRDKGFSELLKMAARVRAGRFDLALIPHRSLRSALVAFLAGIPRRIGFWTSTGFFLLTRRVPRRREAHEVERNLDLLRALDFSVPSRPPRVYPQQKDRGLASEFLARRGNPPGRTLVGIAPGSVWPTKRWLPEGFARVIRELRDQREAQAILFGGPADRELCRQIAQQAGGDVTIAAGELSLLPAAALMERCRLVLSNDSAAAHLAAAVGRPVVAIFGPTVPGFGFTPFGEEDLIVQRQLSCRPCGIHGGRRCPRKTFACMKEIAPEEVLDAVFAVLDSAEESQK